MYFCPWSVPNRDRKIAKEINWGNTKQSEGQYKNTNSRNYKSWKKSGSEQNLWGQEKNIGDVYSTLYTVQATAQW